MFQNASQGTLADNVNSGVNVAAATRAMTSQDNVHLIVHMTDGVSVVYSVSSTRDTVNYMKQQHIDSIAHPDLAYFCNQNVRQHIYILCILVTHPQLCSNN